MFSDLTFAELPQLANMNRDAAGVDISLRRAGNLVILDGRADLTIARPTPTPTCQLTVSFPGEVTSTNGDQIDSDVVEWKLKPGVVSTMSAQARYTDPSTRSFTGAAIWLALAALLVAGVIADAGLGQPRPVAALRRPRPVRRLTRLAAVLPCYKAAARLYSGCTHGPTATQKGASR